MARRRRQAFKIVEYAPIREIPITAMDAALAKEIALKEKMLHPNRLYEIRRLKL